MKIKSKILVLIFCVLSILVLLRIIGISDEKREFKIFCFILTTPDNILSRAQKVNKSWAKECDKYFFAVKLDKTETAIEYFIDKNIPIFEPAGDFKEQFMKLTDKVYKIFMYIYENYNSYDWYLKADDDTFVLMSNLRNFLKDKNPTKAITFGYDLKYLNTTITYHSGGAGYVLSRESLKRLGFQLKFNYSFCPNRGIEDVDVAECLTKLGNYQGKSIDAEGYERFHPIEPKHYIKGEFPIWLKKQAVNPLKNRISGTSISFHKIPIDQIENIHYFWKIINFKLISLFF